MSHVPVQIKCGGGHTALVTNGGYLYTWGSGAHGATGLSHVAPSFEPTAPVFRGVHTSDGVNGMIVKHVSCGKNGTAIVAQGGQVFVTGDNRKRQLGLQGRYNEVNEFTLIPNIYSRIDRVALGLTHMLMLNNQNQVYAVGDNTTGNLGQGHKLSSDMPLKV